MLNLNDSQSRYSRKVIPHQDCLYLKKMTTPAKKSIKIIDFNGSVQL